MTGELASDRKVFVISGADRENFLQGLVTNDLSGLHHGLIYAALLSPQGKYLADFFLVPGDDHILLDIDESIAQSTAKRLAMYRLRADVAITPSDIQVSRGLGPAPHGAYADPRLPELGWRCYQATEANAPAINWDRIRVAHCVPQTGIELVPDDSYILECGFERLHGVDFRKGCYVGQEVTARMKHKTELRKGLATVEIDGQVPVGQEITADGRPVGQVFTQSDGRAIAYLRFDRSDRPMQAGDVDIRLLAKP